MCQETLKLKGRQQQASSFCADDPSADKLGSFLVHAQMQTSVHSSALFLTAAAQNLLCMKLASELGVMVASPWITWFKAAIVPAIIGIVVTPFLMYKVSPCFEAQLPHRELSQSCGWCL